MGDNRDRSADSRFPAMENQGIGLVPENLVGKALVGMPDRWFGKLAQPDQLVYRGTLEPHRGWFLTDKLDTGALADIIGHPRATWRSTTWR